MHKGRLEAFSDGVIAIIITIMVLELKVPHEADLSALSPLCSTFFSYIMSFVFVGIYWNNHHHLLQAVEKINGASMWANLHLLFWLSVVPFVTAWMGENSFARWPVALYGVVLLLCGLAYFIFVQVLLRSHGRGSKLEFAVGSDLKGKISLVIYLVAVGLALATPMSWISILLYLLVSAIWLIPDQRIEKVIAKEHQP